MATAPFKKPSESGNLGPKLTDLEGSLCIFTYRETVITPTKSFGDKTTAVVDVDVIEGVPTGTVSAMPPQAYGEKPAVLEDFTGQHFNRMLVFGGFLLGVFRNATPADMVLGRIQVEGKVTSISTSDKDLRPAWVIADATEEETARALSWLEKKQAAEAKEKFKQPSGGTPVAADAADPEF